MANKDQKIIESLRNDLLLTFYKQSISYYAVRKFLTDDGRLFEATPAELAAEIENRINHDTDLL